ncbi:MAG TPA: YceI family protein [Chryseolinea sp.]|nr:YceI family protein [Chryseolinea sp.]
MNNKMSLPFFILIIASLFLAYRGPETKKNHTSAGFASLKPIGNEKYAIDNKESVVEWNCSMVFADKGGHTGYISISKGELMIEKRQLVSGKVEIDMNTMTDEFHGSNNNLINHLKEADFFDVKKFPIATFAVTNVSSGDEENIKITGNLTIKGITNSVTFPAKIKLKGRILNADGEVTIDRTQWDIRYGSGRFFDDLADHAISDSIQFNLKIVARK